MGGALQSRRLYASMPHSPGANSPDAIRDHISQRRQTMKSWTKVVGASLAAVTAIALASCSSGGSSGGSEAVSTKVSSKKVTLSLVATPESGAPLAKIISAFEAKFPNITVKVQKTTFDDYNKQLPLQLASDSSPDIALINFVGNMAKDHQIISLNEYARLYGWDSIYSSS